MVFPLSSLKIISFLKSDFLVSIQSFLFFLIGHRIEKTECHSNHTLRLFSLPWTWLYSTWALHGPATLVHGKYLMLVYLNFWSCFTGSQHSNSWKRQLFLSFTSTLIHFPTYFILLHSNAYSMGQTLAQFPILYSYREFWERQNT